MRTTYKRGLGAAGCFMPAVMAVALFSCSRTIERPTESDLSFVGPPTPASIVVGVGDQTIDLSWGPVAGAAQYRIYRADTSAATFRRYDSTTQASYTDNNVVNNVLYFYRLASVAAGGLEGVRSPSVSARPGVFSLAINDDEVYTNELAVTLALTAPSGTGSVRLSNSPDLANRPWLTYSASKSWELEPGDGTKTVYAQFRDVSGTTSLGLVSDEIILDTRAIIDSVAENSGGAVLQAGDTVLLTVATGEKDGRASVEVGGYSMDCFDDGTHGDGDIDDGRYHRTWVIPIDADFDSQAVIGHFTDRAGNVAQTRSSATLLAVLRAPDAVTLAMPQPADTNKTSLRLTWTKSSAEDFESYRVYRSPSDMESEGALIGIINDISKTEYTDTDADLTKTNYYWVVVYDRGDLSAKSNVVSWTP